MGVIVSKPHSLIKACRIAADLADVPWSRAQPVYRALQQEGPDTPWLPLSRGRAVWSAQPIFLARFLIAIALTDDPRRASDAIASFANATNEGEGRRSMGPGEFAAPETLADVIAEGLRTGWVGWSGNDDEVPRSGLARVVFQPDEDPPMAIVTRWGDPIGSVRFFNGPRDWLSENHRVDWPRSARRMIRRETTIDGLLLHQISSVVKWGTKPMLADVDDDEGSRPEPPISFVLS